MTFSSAIRYLKDGQATKTSTMRGYVKRTDNELAEGQTANYTLTFVEGNDTDADDKTEYAYTFVTTTEGVTTVTTSDSMTLDTLLLQYLLLDTWETGSTVDFEIVRSGTTNRW